MKVKDEPVPPASPLAILGDRAQALKAEMDRESRAFLPKIAIAWAVQTDLAPYVDRLCVMSGGNVIPLGSETYEEEIDGEKIIRTKNRPGFTGFHLAAFGARPGVKLSKKTDKGTKNEWAFNGGRSDKKIAELLAAGGKKGRSYLVVAIDGDRAYLGSMDLATTQLWYWEELLKRADPQDGAIAKVMVASHKNMIDGEVGSQYYAKEKFVRGKHWQQEAVTQAQRDMCRSLLESAENKEAIEYWLNR